MSQYAICFFSLKANLVFRDFLVLEKEEIKGGASEG